MTEPEHRGPSGRALDEVDKIFRSLVDEEAAPGVSYGVVGRDGLLHAAGHGAVHEDGPCPEAGTAFRIASVTKSFTAASIMILVGRGALSLVDPVARYVPEFRAVRPPTADSAEVTVGMLLSMAGGLPTDDAWADRQESMTREAFGALLTGGIRFVTAPGTAYEYSNLGYALLGCVVEAASGVPYRAFVEDHLLAPLGMTATGFDTSVAAPGGLATGHARLDGRWRAEPFSGPGVFSAIGGLFSTVDDLGRWVRWLAGAFPARDGDDTGPLPRALRREMQQARRAIPVRPRRDTDEHRVASGYGYGLVVENHERWGDVVSHSGGYPGFGSHIRWHPETGLGVIALANGRYAPCHRKAAAAMRVLLSELDPPVEAAELWPETVRAQAAVEGLLRAWDPAVAAAWFAGNVEMDLDLAHRRAEIASLVDDVGPLLDSDTENELIRSDSAAHAEWRVPGTRGELRCEIQLTPQDPPRIQALTVARLEP